MATTGIEINLQDTQIGTAVVGNGNAMLFSLAAEVAGDGMFKMNVPYLITSVADAEALGINAAYDTANKVGLYWNITEFYAKAGTGALLWICGIPKASGAAGALATYFADNTTTGFKAMVNTTRAPQWDNRPRIIGIALGTDPAVDPLTTGSFTANIEQGIPALQTAINELFENSMRVCAVLDANKMAEMPAATTSLPMGGDKQAPNVALAITTSTPGYGASVGRALGWLANVSVGTSIGITTNGQVSPKDYFVDFASGAWKNTNVAVMTNTNNRMLGSKQYLFTLTREGRPGVYYNDDATLNDPTMSLSSLNMVRVGNVICDATAAFLTGVLNQNVPASSSGDLDSAWKSTMETMMYNQILTPQITAGNISSGRIKLAAKDDNIISSSTIVVTIEILPMGKLKEAIVYVMYVNTLD